MKNIKTIKNPIIPISSTFIGEKINLDYKAICCFVATGFFIDDDSYFLEQKALQPATFYTLDSNKIISKETYFNWNYNPIERPLSQVVNEFAELFETIIKEQVCNKKVILPLSGGIDSRTLAAAIYHLGNEVKTYGYEFSGGHHETVYGKKIADVCGFSFEDWKVPNGYLWNVIEDLAQINGCYSEFTHPRQMAFIDQYASLGDVFLLGHWGDVLFDDMGVPDDMSTENQVDVILKKVIKKSGLELADALWKSWQIEGDFKEYLSNRILNLLQRINIPQSANAQIRAFKSLFWATRWTSTNLSVFESVRPIAVPYFDNKMCEFICSVPEKYLSGRQIQIEYLKLRMPSLAKIMWQDHRPFNLYNYRLNRFPYNFPYKVFNKIRRTVNSKKYIQRNWELQFINDSNEYNLKKWLFENANFKQFIPPDVVNDFYAKFKKDDSVYYSHSISILLTLSLFSIQNKDES